MTEQSSDIYSDVLVWQNRGRYAGPTRGVAAPIGTRSEIFPFNEFARTDGLNKPSNEAEGTVQTHLRNASNLSFALAFSTTLGVSL